MSEQYVFDETGKSIIYANPNFKTYTIPQNVTNIANGNKTHYAFINVSKQSETFELNFEENCEIENIGDYAFYSCKQLTKINFDNAVNLQYIGKFAFASCTKLTSLDFTNAISFQGFNSYGAFRGCSKLSSVKFAEKSNVTIIRSGTFRLTAITTFRIPYKCSYITGETFGYCNIEQFTVEPGNKYFDVYNGSLYNYERTTLICYASTNPVLQLPEETTEIGFLAFEGYPHSLIIPKQIINYSQKAFFGYCGASLTIMCPPKIIDSNFFSDSQFKELYFLDSVSIINENAFDGCSKLKYVYFISPVTKLYEQSFPSIDKICFAGEVDSIQNCLPTTTINVCQLTFLKNRTYNNRECRSLSQYLPFTSIFLLYTL